MLEKEFQVFKENSSSKNPKLEKEIKDLKEDNNNLRKDNEDFKAALIKKDDEHKNAITDLRAEMKQMYNNLSQNKKREI